MNNQVKLTDAERVELSYLLLKGFRYLVRNEIGSVNVFVNKPHRDKETNYKPYGKTRGGYDHWIETKTPIPLEEQRRRRDVELGKYDFIRWEDEPMLIELLINPDPVPTIKPGDKVKHKLNWFGIGEVQKIRGRKAYVTFAGYDADDLYDFCELEVVE